jgi:hypothetical protein
MNRAGAFWWGFVAAAIGAAVVCHAPAVAAVFDAAIGWLGVASAVGLVVGMVGSGAVRLVDSKRGRRALVIVASLACSGDSDSSAKPGRPARAARVVSLSPRTGLAAG